MKHRLLGIFTSRHLPLAHIVCGSLRNMTLLDRRRLKPTRSSLVNKDQNAVDTSKNAFEHCYPPPSVDAFTFESSGRSVGATWARLSSAVYRDLWSKTISHSR